MSDKLAKRRFKSIMGRNYTQKLNYFLFEVYTKKKKITDLNTIKYALDDKIQIEYKKLYQDMAKIRKRNKCIKKIIDNYKELLKTDKELYFQHYAEKILPLADFNIFWNKENGRSCQYCGISEKQINELYKSNKIETKRFYSRGKTMEIDKIDAFKEYTKDNIILSCYWCNNAKTDEFSLEEFKSIAKGINEVWNNRLGSSNIKFPDSTYNKENDCNEK